MLQLTFSNGFDPLAAALASDIERWRAGDLGRLLCGLPVAVPDRLVARAFDLALADQNGISVNINFPFLAGALANCLGPDLASRLLSRERITERLILALGDERLLAKPDLDGARRYVETGESRSSATRRVELATELTRLYLDYASSRPVEFLKWTQGQVNFGDGPNEQWQRALWIYISTGQNETNSGPAPLTSMTSMTSKAPITSMAPLAPLLCTATDDQLVFPPALFVVAAADFAPAHRLMLERLAAHSDIFVYALNPCREFWEDLDKTPDECPPLAYWGSAGRASMRLLSEAVNFDWVDRFVDPTTDSALDRIKSDILSRSSGHAARTRLSADASITIASCPSVRRELEFIAENIWMLCRKHSDLELTDVAVLLAGSDRDIYRAQLSSVFGELGRLPHHIVDVPLLEESRVAEAFSWLLELPLGTFTRPEMLRVVAHPRIGGGDPDIDSVDWVRWARDLGVFFGEDRSSHAGTYLPGDLYHWDQALLRLGLGACVEIDPAGSPVSLANRVVLPHHQTPDQRRSAGRLTLLCRSLFADIAWLRTQRMPLGQWATVLWRFASAYIDAPTDKQKAALGRCRNALARIGESVHFRGDDCEDDGDHGDTSVGLDVALSLTRSALGQLRTRRGEPLVDGICVSALGTAPLVPFRFVFIAGLSSGAFPSGSDRGGSLDVRENHQLAFEPSPRERDRYAFLLALHTATEAVVCSYVGRDPQTGETLPPSSVLAELRQLSSRELTSEALERALVIVPPWAHDDPDVEQRGVNLRARRRQRAARLAAKWAPADSLRSRRHALEHVRKHANQAERRLLGLETAQADDDDLTQTSRELSASQLTAFLESPLDSWSRVVLGIGSRESSERNASTEPLDLTPLDAAIIAREAVCGAAIDGVATSGLRARIDAAAEARRLRGLGPSGVVFRWQLERTATQASKWWDVFREVKPDQLMTSIAIGRAAQAADIRELLPPIDLGEAPMLEGHGMLPLISAGANDLFYFQRSERPIYARGLRGLIDHALLAAANRVKEAESTIFIVDEKAAHTITLRSFEASEARTYLRELANALVCEPHAYLLLGTKLLANHLRGKPLLDGLERAALGPRPAYLETLRRRPGDFDLPGNLGEILESRYLPLFSRIVGTR